MKRKKEVEQAISIVGGHLGQTVESQKLFDSLTSLLAKRKQQDKIAEQIGLASPARKRAYFRNLARKTAASVSIPKLQASPPKFSGVGDASSESAISEGKAIKAGVDAISDGLDELGLDLPAEIDSALEITGQLAACATAIGIGASQGAAIGTLATSGACTTGIGCIITGAGAEIGTIVGVVSAAWQCGLFDLALEGLEFLVDTVGDVISNIFDPEPENFLWYMDVGGPALRPNGWTPSSDYDRRFFNVAFGPLTPAARAQAEKTLTTRIAGSKLSGYTGVWLIRRTKELGGGAEEWARVSKILGVERGPQKKDTTQYDRLVAVYSKLDSKTKALMKPTLVAALTGGGFNSLEAQEKVYGKKPKSAAQVQARIELGVLRAMLTRLEPGKKEMAERIAIAKKLLNNKDPLAGIDKKMASGKTRSGTKSDSAGMGAIGLVAIAGAAFLLLRRK